MSDCDCGHGAHTVEERNGDGPWRKLVTYYYDSGFQHAAAVCDSYRQEAARVKGLWQYRITESDGTVCVGPTESTRVAERAIMRSMRASQRFWNGQ